MSSTRERMKPYEFPAFRMIDDIYYVGGSVGSFLITSDEGHILIDTVYPEYGSFILKGILDLGFSPRDIKYIAITHAHFDHTGSATMLAEATGAQVCIGELDREAAEQGSERQPPIKIDKSLKDGDVIAFGDKEILVYHTPGHTVGNVSFGFKIAHEGRVLNGFLIGGFAVRSSTAPARYDGALQDYKKTLDRLESLNVDVWFVSHPEPSDIFGKFELLRRGGKPNPFIDPAGWKAFLTTLRGSLIDGNEVGPASFPLYSKERPYFLKPE